MTPAKIRVLIVEDSVVVQKLLEHTIGGDPRFAVVGKAADADEAMRLITATEPDVVTMDIRLPKVDGFELTRRIMSEYPRPIVVVAENVDDRTLNISMNALRAGALTVVEKPGSTERQSYEGLAEHLRTQLAIMSQVKVVRQRFGIQTKAPLPPPLDARRIAWEILALVASTGGPAALARLLNDLPQPFPLPVLVVQHIGDRFAAGFAQWLGSVVPFPVEVAPDGELPQAGRVYVAPAGHHLALSRGRLRNVDSPPICLQRPSGDVLFSSIAEDRGGRAIGVLMTGMGEDGARGLLALRQAGGFTIAEDQSTAVIYGMPAAAMQLGAASEQLPLDRIGARISWLIGVEATQQ